MLALHDISVRLGGRHILQRVSLRIAAGEVLGVIGPPESGKSTLLKVMAGLVLPDQGAVQWEREAVAPASWSWRQHVGMGFQNDALFDAMSVGENVAFPLARRRVPEAERGRAAEAMLSAVGLTGAAALLPAELSGGMRKRVGIARALVAEPRVALFDDPTAGLDPATARHILDLVVELSARRGAVTVVVSNDVDLLLARCGSLLMLRNGESVYWGSPLRLERDAPPEVARFVSGVLDEGS